jgi:group I intron endonuclease
MLIYKITNQLTGDFYIGKTQASLTTRWKRHLKGRKTHPHLVLYRAMEKYGVENFVIEEIDRAESAEALCEMEINHITELKPKYNMTKGGDGGSGPHTEEFKNALRQRNLINNPMKGKTGDKNHFYGKKHTEETLKKITKEFSLISPDGDTVSFRNLNAWCRERGFSAGSMHSVIAGRISSYKGYTRAI